MHGDCDQTLLHLLGSFWGSFMLIVFLVSESKGLGSLKDHLRTIFLDFLPFVCEDCSGDVVA